MAKVINWLIANQAWLIPLVVYVALNLAKRDFLVNNSNPVIRGAAGVLEKILLLEWQKWGGNLKFLVSDEPKQ